MNKAILGAVVADRRSKQNPYAHLDYLEELESSPVPRLDVKPKSDAPRGKSLSSKLHDRQIERKARELQVALWNLSLDRNGGRKPSDPAILIDPVEALALIGFEVQFKDGLGQYRSGKSLIEVAGIIDHKQKRVCISGQFSPKVQRFTLAHELGHAALHPNMGVVHRDRPLDGTSGTREQVEYEADRFATYFLMPAKLVCSRFEELFLTTAYVPNEESLFALRGWTPADLESMRLTRRDLSRLLATAEQYNGKHFHSLADQFGVSTEAMAIRLEELDLVTA